MLTNSNYFTAKKRLFKCLLLLLVLTLQATSGDDDAVADDDIDSDVGADGWRTRSAFRSDDGLYVKNDCDVVDEVDDVDDDDESESVCEGAQERKRDSAAQKKQMAEEAQLEKGCSSALANTHPSARVQTWLQATPHSLQQKVKRLKRLKRRGAKERMAMLRQRPQRTASCAEGKAESAAGRGRPLLLLALRG